MRLLEGKAGEYKRRHDALWPELKQLLKDRGISDYSIFLNEETNDLLGVLKAEDELQFQALAGEPVMRKWWSYMKDLMETHPDNSPVSLPLREVFYLP